MRKKKQIVNTIILILVILTIMSITIFILPNFKTIPYSEYLNTVSNNKITTVYEDNIVNSENQPIFQDNEIFLPIDFVSKFIDEYIFWDSSENILTIANEKNLIRMNTDNLEYYINHEPFKLNFPVFNINNLPYLPSDILEELYPIDINYYPSSNILTLDNKSTTFNVGTISKNKSVLRYNPNRKSPIIKKLSANDEVIILGKSKNEKYSKVRCDDGHIGWIKSKKIINIYERKHEIKEKKYEKKEKWKPKKGERINLIFDQINNVKENKSEAKRITHNGINVLSPTWFSFKDTSGDIKNIADKSYVDWAHKNDYQVWGLITDNFNAEISHAVLSSTKTREHVIKQLSAFVSIYNLDGINIDFENVPKKDGNYFVQFIRELYPVLNEQGAVLSIDTFVPKPWTKHYNRKEISKIADYIIVMGYDEHYAGSKTSGSVASYPWSVEAIKSSLEEGIPKEKLILGVPFYTRIWTETKNKLTSKAYGMAQAKEFMTKKGAKITFDKKTGQNYSEITEGDNTYKVWFEDEFSMENRAKLVSEYNIAGIGAWKRGLDVDGIDTLIANNIK